MEAETVRGSIRWKPDQRQDQQGRAGSTTKESFKPHGMAWRGRREREREADRDAFLMAAAGSCQESILASATCSEEKILAKKKGD
jgi:hypothetical protein